ncbi:uncharacterized protein LOC129779913 [Toxorhynchites rutilus septentrionalis]|uniref:uncharacterized protein LOC129779913 n=1 Tax=Toxorhynchites rutilus septentrionalis TaxID=329112 RepID=UPI00247AB77E|nr:uncharacterized protein LOC129779913 [Toxorhynchites rutilus septentrionalis]
MRQYRPFYRKRTLDYSDKYRNLAKFCADVEHFLEEYENIVEQRLLYRRDFKRHLREVETNLSLLLSKFRQIKREECHNQFFKELFCCGKLFENCDELREHYFAFHNAPRLVHPNIVELKSGRAKLEHFRNRLEEYLNYGTECTAALVINLQKLLASVSRTLYIDSTTKNEASYESDTRIYRWRVLTKPDGWELNFIHNLLSKKIYV